LSKKNEYFWDSMEYSWVLMGYEWDRYGIYWDLMGEFWENQRSGDVFSNGQQRDMAATAFNGHIEIQPVHLTQQF